jgi:tripartite-type tricarboxylate transporter receptor subunit TctC
LDAIKMGLLARAHWVSLIVVAVLTAASAANAEGWPVRPVKIVVAYSAGGSGDILARALAQKLTQAIGESFYVENRPGASGNLGTDFVAKATPDGYTLLLGSDIQFAIAPNFDSNVPFKVAEFAPISLVADVDLVLVANPSLQANNVRELIDLAKQEPGGINYGSTGPGSTHELATELLQQLGHFKLTEIPYRGSSQTLPDLLSGQTQLMLLGVPQSLPYLRDHQLKALAVGALRRIHSLPYVPTIAEQGFPGFEATNYWCLYAPAGTSRDIIARLQEETTRAVNEVDLRELLLASGFTPVGSTPEVLAERIDRDSEKWARVLRIMREHESKK